ncbi:MFS transporter [Robertmurraya massiliosenegalensis]|uniref:MFS transporter n=1 Tax=Robertmurraya massiliosenegalensis TaxID=1287657 RepID=UPI00031C54B7|nr:MFS transporter [Robertmurraya massiliosenegalensis]
MFSQDKQPVVALALITAICLAGDSMLYIVLPTHWKEVGLTSLVQVGILLSVNRFVRLPLNPLIGYIYKKVNFRSGILLAVILSGITTISYGLVENFKIWVFLRSIWGFSWALFKLGGYLLILQFSTDMNRGNVMGTYNGLYRLGSLFGMLFGGFFADLIGMKTISIVIGFFAFLSICIIYKYIPKTVEIYDVANKTHPSNLSNKRYLFDKPLVKRFITAFLVMMLLDGMLTATLGHIIEVKYTNNIEVFHVIIGAATLAGIMQALRWGISPIVIPQIGNLLDRSNHNNVILGLFLSCASILSFLLPFQIQLGIWLPILFLHLIVSSILINVMDTIVAEYASKQINKIFIMTTFTIIVDLGAALGPITSYFLEQKIGLESLFWITAGVCCLLSIIWIIPRNQSGNREHRMYHEM